MELTTIWFLAIAILWTGYFVLEGFDFGVGILLPVVGRNNNTDRRVLINTIGPVWDGNEVWLITAVGATFAAFPAWYGSMLSGFYLPMLLILLALIGRGVAFEYRHKGDTDAWRRGWDATIIAGSAIPAFLWGLIFANMLRGLPMDADHVVTAHLSDLLNPYALLGGVATFTLFTLHGAVFLSLKTDGAVRYRARRAAVASAAVAAPALVGFVAWTHMAHGSDTTGPLAVVAAGALAIGVVLSLRGREGWSFTATATSVLSLSALLFASLFPDVLPSSTDPAHSLTITNAASAEYTLTVMSWIAVVFLPLVLLYQSWSYWVFRQRVTRRHVDPTASDSDSDSGSTAAATDPAHRAGSTDTAPGTQ
ncbi:cytochrome d ubiquinol oxidase subunit II [Lipingzhangella sp. LS1_29]|uniref:Cytochrome d ubiquinol oxidase subunit II n=1 Tax=Lipingzhangella rawalii TaxID=2055835 RepID=A0ABU2H5T3_9ACTN|nr:cytochrome d ubiquinol oxidase subunit II [Lipingzhangella rawalii]MDS1270667.1 cytochrome d ubiquinol oxidase subunit II [Lipingzhangella rawalii]